MKKQSKKLSQRIASMTPSITVGLILFAVGLTALLAYRAFDASRAQQQMTEGTLREYAGFAAFQLKNSASARLMAQNRGAFELVVQQINTRGPTPSLGAERVAALIAERGQMCRCLEGVSFYYQVTFADGRINASASALATAANLARIRDTVLALARAQSVTPGRIDPPLSNPAAPRPRGVAVTSQSLVTIFSRLDDRAYVLSHALTADATGKPVVAYGFAVPAEHPVGRAVRGALAGQPVLPTTLTRGLSVDSILSVTVRTPAREVVYSSNASVARRYAATDSLEARLGGLHFEVAINPATAGRLIIGGLPQSRLPEVLATAFVAVGLLGLLLYQFRRQEELGRLRDDFVSGVSHELRTPLTQIRLLAELLQMEKVPTAEQKERSLRIIDKEARRLTFLVESILSFTNSNRGTLVPVETNVTSEIEEIISGFEPLAHANEARLMTSLEPGLTAMVDPRALRQVLLNLLDNAVRYGPQGQTIAVATTSTPATWLLSVEDQGPGVPADERDRIFAPYYRMSRDHGGAVGGTGIGLAVVRRLVDDHGGRVRVTAVDGVTRTGARFVVEFPRDARGAADR